MNNVKNNKHPPLTSGCRKGIHVTQCIMIRYNKVYAAGVMRKH